MVYYCCTLILINFYAAFSTSILPGTYMMEKVSFKNSKKLTLAATLWKAPSDAIVIMAHGSAGNRFARGLFSNIAQALQKERYNVLAFDFSGHGESDNNILTLAQSIDDVACVINFAKDHGYKKIALVGHSLGAYPCLANFSSDISTMVLIGALTGPVVWDWETMCSPEQLEGLRKTGYIVAEVNDGLRSIVTVDGNLLQNIQAIDQEKLLQTVKCPVLIIHGDADQQERDLLEITQKGFQYLPRGSQLKFINGATHSFLESCDTVIGVAKEWLKTHFSL